MSDITRILERVQRGEAQAAEELVPLVYQELRRMAAQQMAKEAPGQTLQPTALVHEAWLRLAGDRHQHWNGRGHFFAAAAEAMRRILIDRARRKHRICHGYGLTRVGLEEADLAVDAAPQALLELDEGLAKLAEEDRVKAELVKLRFFVGMSLVEAGDVLGLSESTAKRHWAYARAWLYDELTRDK